MNNKENKMGTAPIGQLMIKMAIPVIISMVLQACYNIVDSIFVSHMPDSGGISGLGEYGVNALTLAFPLQMLIGAFGVGTGVGVNALLSRKLGEKDFERVGLASGNGTFLGLLIYAGFIVFGIFGIDPYTFSQTNDPVSIEMCSAYLRINIFAGFGLIFFGIHEKLLQATGKTIYSTIAQITGAAVNLILDPIMIFGFLGMPALGIAGAAWATVIGQIASMVVAVALHYTKNKEVPKGLRYFRPEGRTIKDILSVGVPAIIMQGLLSVMSYGINIIFGNVSPAAVTAYGVFFKMQQFLLYAIFGFRDVITPIISYNYGMKDRQRVMQGIRYGTLYI